MMFLCIDSDYMLLITKKLYIETNKLEEDWYRS